MTDITKIAQSCASRIMDRMEMCRGSAILKSDIEREIETALREMMDAFNPAPGGVVWCDETGIVDPSIIEALDAAGRQTPPELIKHFADVYSEMNERSDEPAPAFASKPAVYGTSPADISELGKGIARLGREIHDEAARIRKPVGRYIRKSDESDDN